MNQEELIRVMAEARAAEEERNKVDPETREEMERVELQRQMIDENRRRMAEAYASQIHDREIAALTQDLSLEEEPPADEELVVTRYEPQDAASVRQV